MRDYVTVVTGMPRSGTSLLTRMLDAGGVPALTDRLRRPDPHNPHGYFEYEPVKRLAEDSSWIARAPGHAVKIICRLLPHLPPGFEYRVVFMERDLAEVFASQRDMLLSRADPAAVQPAEIIASMAVAMRDARKWLASQPNIRTLAVPYAQVVRAPAASARRLSAFLDGLDEPAMAAMVDPSLYRHRNPSPGR